MVLVVGGTGQLGSVVVEKLLHEGRAVRVLSHTPERAERLRALGAEVAQGDLRDRASLERACRDVDEIVAAAHAVMGRGRAGSRFVDDEGNRALIDVAKAARVRHFVFVSALGADPKSPVDFFRIKHGVERHLEASGLSYTILRPPAFMETWAKLVGEPVVQQGKVTLFGPGTNPVNFISASDVAHFVLVALDNPEARGRTLAIGGPENLTLREVAAIFERVSGKRAKVKGMPSGMIRLMAALIAPFHEGVARVMRMSYLMATTDQRFDPSPTLREFPYPLTRLEEWARFHYGSAEVPAPRATVSP